MLEKHLCLVFGLLSVVKIEIEASTENKARVNAEIKARKKYNTNFVKSVNVKYLGIYKES